MLCSWRITGCLWFEDHTSEIVQIIDDLLVIDNHYKCSWDTQVNHSQSLEWSVEMSRFLITSNISSILPIHDRISIALCTADEALVLHRSRIRSMHFYTLERNLYGFLGPASLCDLYRFAQKMQSTLRHVDKQVLLMSLDILKTKKNQNALPFLQLFKYSSGIFTCFHHVFLERALSFLDLLVISSPRSFPTFWALQYCGLDHAFWLHITLLLHCLLDLACFGCKFIGGTHRSY